MTLVVARIEQDRIAIVADTMIVFNDAQLPMKSWTLKSICLPGRINVSYSGSPELSMRSFKAFSEMYPSGAGFEEVIRFFEESSRDTNNDYIIAFLKPARLITVRDGRRRRGISKTHWIGDKPAYERFREYEARQRKPHHHPRAVSTVLFADEMPGSKASDLYSAMKSVTLDRDILSVGGFITAISGRDEGFRFSVYSDILFDWPSCIDIWSDLEYTSNIDLSASGENDRFSISQISPGYCNVNFVAFYVLKGRLLVIFYEASDGTIACAPIRGIEPQQISDALDGALKLPFHALCIVMSARQEFSGPIQREKHLTGLGLQLFCEVNTFPR